MNLLREKKNKKGFALIELIVAIAIMGIVLSVAVYNHRDFGNNVNSRNLAYDVALSIREAQTFGVSVRQYGTGGSASFNVPYGVFITKTNPNTYIFFVDKNENRKYDAGLGCASGDTNTECLDSFSLLGGYSIGSFCTVSSGSCNNKDELHITFKRPNPDAIILDDESGFSDKRSSAELEIYSPQGPSGRKVVVISTGNISIK